MKLFKEQTLPPVYGTLNHVKAIVRQTFEVTAKEHLHLRSTSCGIVQGNPPAPSGKRYMREVVAKANPRVYKQLLHAATHVCT